MNFSEQIILSLLEKITDGVVLYKVRMDGYGDTRTFEYLAVNEAWESLNGLKREDLIGRTVLEVGGAGMEEPEAWNRMLCEVLIKACASDHVRYSRKRGRWYRISCFIPEEGYLAAILSPAIPGEKGSIPKAKLERTDMDMLRMQKELRENERRLNAAQKIARIGNWELDLKTNIFWASKEAFRLYGIPVHNAYRFYEDVRKVHSSDNLELLDKAIYDLIHSGIPMDVKYALDLPDGEKRYLHSLAEVEQDGDGNSKRLLGTLRDITQEVLHQKELEKKNEELSGLYEEILASEEELKQQNEELFQKREEISGLYEELTAQDEELRTNYEQLAESMERLKKSEEINQLIIDAASEGVWQYDLTEDRYVISPHFIHLLGYEPEEVNAPLWVSELTHPQDREMASNSFNEHLAGKKDYYEAEYRLKRKDGTYMWIKSTGKIKKYPEGEAYLMAGTFSDLTKLKEQQARLEYLAYHDTLTGLIGRSKFLSDLEAAIEEARAENGQLAILFMDLDNFKNINDTLGHGVGDLLLQAVASRLLLYNGKDCLLARLGGDEFAVLLRRIPEKQELYNFCGRLKEVITEPFGIRDYSFNVSVSIGIARYPEEGMGSDELLKNADTAMYHAKSIGKNSIQFFDKEMQSETLRRIMIESHLKDAIKEKNFMLYYQPQFSLQSGKIRAFEALLRWTDRELGPLSPAEFIPIAENAGLIVPLGEWILREALRQGMEFGTTCGRDILMSVNISAIQLKQANFVEMVKKVLEETKFPCSLLELEVTETTMISSFEHAVSIFHELRALGIKISLDDFGTGYSSLSYLKTLPIDTLKIDKSFIHDIDNTAADRNIIASVISLAHNLQTEVVAEGVETQKQLEYLSRHNCDSVQGYLTGRPVPATEAAKLLENPYL